jgi:hypothetical protein
MQKRTIIGLAACAGIIIACFLPWSFYPDLGKNFTGFFSEGNKFGRPGYFLVFFALLSAVCYLIKNKNTVFFNATFSVITLAYIVRCYFVFTQTVMGVEAQPKAGIYLLVVSGLINVIMVLLSKAPK